MENENLKANNENESDSIQNQSNPTPNVINKSYSSTKPIVSVVLSFLGFNILGIIFSILSLVKYNKYEQALFAGDSETAQLLGKSSSKLAKAAFIITLIVMIIRPIIFVCAFLAGSDTLGLLGDGGAMDSEIAIISSMI